MTTEKTSDDYLDYLDELKKMPPQAATATQILGQLSELVDDFFSKNPGDGGFVEHVFAKIVEANTSGAEQEEMLSNWGQQPERMRPFALLQVIWVSCAYAIEALRYTKQNEVDKAWQSAATAQYWLGIAKGAWSIRKDKPQSIVDFSRKGAAAAHAENRAMKQQVFSLLDSNPPKPRGKDAAAEKIAGKIVPVTFRTARAWIDEWEKNKRSTGTP